MPGFSTPAILLKRIDHGDYDLIITFFSLSRGRISVIAKSAKKSVKRFAGILELFSVLRIVCSQGRGKGMRILQEASVENLLYNIRGDIKKTAYASYWAELIYDWMEEEEAHADLFYLLKHVLSELDQDGTPVEPLSVFFQMRFVAMIGFSPNLNECSGCRRRLDGMQCRKFTLNLEKGGLVCEKCAPRPFGNILLSKGTIKQLLWLQHRDIETAKRVRLTPQAIGEGLAFLEYFVPYHLGREPKSLKFLKQIRG
jgi:DNA repair protein RecO (recombination protein O)